MNVSNWEHVCDELRATLIQTYPTIIWRVEFFADKGNTDPDEHAGLAVRARRGRVEREIRVPATAVRAQQLSDLADQIKASAERALASSS